MFRINYELKKPKEIVPWGEENKSRSKSRMCNYLSIIDIEMYQFYLL